MLEPDGQKLAALMTWLGWEAEELCAAAEVSSPTLKKFLMENRCSLRTIMRIARTLKINPSEIMKVR